MHDWEELTTNLFISNIQEHSALSGEGLNGVHFFLSLRKLLFGLVDRVVGLLVSNSDIDISVLTTDVLQQGFAAIEFRV